MLQNHQYYEPMSWPAQTLHTSYLSPQHHSLKGSFVPGTRGDAWVGALKALCPWLIDCYDHIFGSSGPTLLSSSSLSPMPWNVPQPCETPSLGWTFSSVSVQGAEWPRWMNTWDQTTDTCKGQEEELWPSEVALKSSHVRLNQVYTTDFEGLFLT